MPRPTSSSQQTLLAQSAVSSHVSTVALFGHDAPLKGEHTSLDPDPPPTQQYCVVVSHDVDPQAIRPGSHAAPPSGVTHDDAAEPPSECPDEPAPPSLEASPASLGLAESAAALEASSEADAVASSPPPLEPPPSMPSPPLDPPL
jgi:hypothetical protein